MAIADGGERVGVVIFQHRLGIWQRVIQLFPEHFLAPVKAGILFQGQTEIHIEIFDLDITQEHNDDFIALVFENLLVRRLKVHLGPLVFQIVLRQHQNGPPAQADTLNERFWRSRAQLVVAVMEKELVFGRT